MIITTKIIFYKLIPVSHPLFDSRTYSKMLLFFPVLRKIKLKVYLDWFFNFCRQVPLELNGQWRRNFSILALYLFCTRENKFISGSLPRKSFNKAVLVV